MKKYILKHAHINEKNLRYDFLPSMIEIIERPSHCSGSVIIYGILLLLISTFIWAALFQLDVVVSANGIVVPQGDIVTVQTKTPGIVEQILVNDADMVKKGDILLRMETADVQRQIETLEYQKGVLECQKKIYEKIYHGEELDKVDVKEYGVYEYVANGIVAEQALYASKEKEYEQQIKDADDKEMAQTQLESYRIERNMEVLRNISNLSIQLQNKETELKQKEEDLRDKTVVALCGGTVTKVQGLNEGSLVNASQAVFYSIPLESQMVFRCYVKSADIALLQEGEMVRVKLSAYPYAKYGDIEGTILNIGEITANIENVGVVYPVSVTLQEKEEINLRSGLTGNCELIVDQRTVLEYFLEPVIKGFNSSLKEP